MELVGVVVVEQFEGLSDCLRRLDARAAAPVGLLEDRRLAPTDGPDGGCVDGGFTAVRGEGSQDRGEFIGQPGQAQVGIPETQIERVGHLPRF